MKSIIAFTLCALLFASALATEVESGKKKNLMETLHKLKNTAFGQHLIKTIDLQLRTTGATDDALNLLVSIRADLGEQSEQETNEFNRDSTEINNNINDLTAESQSALFEVDEANTRIGEIWSQLSDLEDEIPRLENEVVRIRGQKQKLERLREDDIEDYVRRTAEQRQVVEVITQIINSLSEIALSGNSALVQKDEIIKRLHSTKYTEPLIALTDLSSTFDPQFLRNVIVRLEHIRDGIIEAVEQDQEDEAEAKLNYDNIHGQLEDLQYTFVNDWAAAKRDQKSLNNDLTVETNRRDSNKDVYDAAENAKANAEQELQQITDEHNARQSHYEQELDVLGEALNVLTVNAPSLRNYD